MRAIAKKSPARESSTRPSIVLSTFLTTALFIAMSSTASSAVPRLTVGAQNANIGQPDIQHSQEDLEALRGRFLDLVDGVQEASGLLKSLDAATVEKLNHARALFENMPVAQLNVLRQAIDPLTMNIGLSTARSIVAQSRRNAMVGLKALPDRTGPDSVCDAIVGAGRPSAAATIAVDTVYLVAAGVRAAASRACNQVAVAVVLGEGGGGNGSLACVATDVVFFLAQAVRDKFAACDNDYTKRTIDANYERLGQIHLDIDNAVANDNSNRAALLNNANANKDTIVAGATANTLAINALATANKSQILTNADANKAAVITVANANTATLVGAITTATATLRDLILRMQIESALSEGKDPVVIFTLPATSGGYLELVRTIVAQSIANVQASGGTVGDAAADLAKGDVFKTAARYKDAYVQYRTAYQDAGKK